MSSAAMLEQLTPREREILALIGEGYSLPEIAQRLHRSIKTVETHRLTLGRKLNATNRVELARIAIATGLVRLETSAPATPLEHLSTGPINSDEALLLRDLRTLDARTGVATGACYLRYLVCALTQVLDVEYAGVCELVTLDGQLMSRILYMSQAGQFADSFMYPLRGTPCEDTYRKGEQLCISRVVETYPEDKELADMLLDSYLGLRLDARPDRPIGLLWLADTKPMEHAQHARAVLAMIAQRCAGELHRSIDMLQELERVERREQIKQELGLPDLLISRSNTRLDSLMNVFRDFAQQMPLAVIALDNTLSIHFANRATQQLFGYSEQQLMEMSSEQLFTAESLAAYRDTHAHACETGDVLTLTLMGRRSDGSAFPVTVARSGLFDEHGQVSGTLALIAPGPDSD